MRELAQARWAIRAGYVSAGVRKGQVPPGPVPGIGLDTGPGASVDLANDTGKIDVLPATSCACARAGIAPPCRPWPRRGGVARALPQQRVPGRSQGKSGGAGEGAAGRARVRCGWVEHGGRGSESGWQPKGAPPTVLRVGPVGAGTLISGRRRDTTRRDSEQARSTPAMTGLGPLYCCRDSD